MQDPVNSLPNGRNRTIDAFRGISIVGMVFFTLTLKLSANLPEPLRHNVRGSFHAGDVILPMFLFASGMSLAYFMKAREGMDSRTLSRDVARRFSVLAIVAVVLSPISARAFLEMDEVMLSALLFPVCVLLSRYDWKASVGIIAILNLLYLAVVEPGFSGIDLSGAFTGHYLGGYSAAPFYLPVMLSGLLVGKGFISGVWHGVKGTALAISALFVISTILVPIEKMTVTPSFVSLSILVSLFLAWSVSKLLIPLGCLYEIRNIGVRPLRYWLLMYGLLLAPLTVFVRATGGGFPLELDWPLGLMLAACAILFLWMASYAIDYAASLQKKGGTKPSG